MIRYIYKIDSEGVYTDYYIADVEKNVYYNGEEWSEIDFSYVEAKPPHAKVARWDGSKWIVIEEYPIEPIEPQPPTPEERLTAVEEALLLLLMEV